MSARLLELSRPRPPKVDDWQPPATPRQKRKRTSRASIAETSSNAKDLPLDRGMSDASTASELMQQQQQQQSSGRGQPGSDSPRVTLAQRQAALLAQHAKVRSRACPLSCFGQEHVRMNAPSS